MPLLKETHPDNLADRHERALAKLARIARCDAWHGGARALVLAKRLEAMGGNAQAIEAVTDAYTNGRGDATRFLAYECPECGTACAGTEAAHDHCAHAFACDDTEETEN